MAELFNSNWNAKQCLEGMNETILCTYRQFSSPLFSELYINEFIEKMKLCCSELSAVATVDRFLYTKSPLNSLVVDASEFMETSFTDLSKKYARKSTEIFYIRKQSDFPIFFSLRILHDKCMFHVFVCCTWAKKKWVHWLDFYSNLIPAYM